MRMIGKDRTQFSFGKISDPGVLARTGLSGRLPRPEDFTTRNFQYTVDHVADLFGLAHGTIRVQVEEQDYRTGWLDQNQNGRVDAGELVMQFTMNASIQPYTRESVYGKHFMYQTALKYGTPVIFGIAAHEVGHLMNLIALAQLETRVVGGRTLLVQTAQVQARWDELCADYLAGIVLAKALPRLNQEPLKEFLRFTQEDEDHPDGFWRTFAVEMGYQWGCNNSPLLTDRILSNTGDLRQLLQGFFKAYYEKVYCAILPSVRASHSVLPRNFMEPTNITLSEL